MKFSIATLALTQAAKNGKGGKHGNLDLSNDRYVWKVPSCISNPDLCSLRKTLTRGQGKIVLDQDNYNNYEVRFSKSIHFLKHFSKAEMVAPDSLSNTENLIVLKIPGKYSSLM